MLFTLEKLENRMRSLESIRYMDMEDLFPMTGMEDTRSHDETVVWPPQGDGTFEVGKHHFIVGRDKYVWLHKTLTLPKAKEGFQIVGLFDMGKTGDGTNSGFESLLYVDEHIRQAVDSNHREVFFDDSEGGRNVMLDFMLWSGLEGGGPKKTQIMHIQQAQIGYMHILTDAFYYISKAIVKTLKMMPQTDPLWTDLLALLNEAYLSIDLSENKEILYGQIENTYDCLMEKLETLGQKTEVTVHCVGHTHIDVAWLWRLKHTREKAIRSFSTVTRYMELYPEYKFVQSQPQLYQYVKDYAPELYERMKKNIKTGRFEPEGGMWVEADCNISSGEALVRQILEGTKFFEKEFGKRSTCLWLPDVFGYSVALPQILKQFNISRFVTTKISWNEYNKMPHDTFMWRGLDGSEVLTHFITTPEIGRPIDHMYSTYNGQISPRTVIGTWNKYEDKDINKDLLISYGYGDGGGGPTRNMIMMRRALDKIPGIPKVKSTGVKEYLDIVEDHVKHTNGYVHTWNGELYLETHRGTYTSQARNKWQNRRTEYGLIHAEMLGVMSLLQGGAYEAKTLEDLWRVLLLNQFHDIIPGSSIHEVYEDSQKQYAKVWERLDDVFKKHGAKGFTAQKDVYTAMNYTLFDRTELWHIAREDEGIFTDMSGCVLQSQKTNGGYDVAVPMVPMGAVNIVFKLQNRMQDTSPFVYTQEKKQLDTPYYQITFNAWGMMTSIYDKENGREVLRGFGNRLTVYEDRPFDNDAWNIDIFHTEKYEVVTGLIHEEVVENGALKFSIKRTYAYRNSVITQMMTCYAHSRRIDFETEADWHENHRLLKTCFEVDVDNKEASYDIQFGNVKRPTHFNTSWDYAKFEVAAHKWIDLSETGYGTALLNNCKYGFSVHDSLMSISLIKCATFPDTQADQGHHQFTYAFLPHRGTWQESGVHQESEFLNQPVKVRQGSCIADGKSLFKVDKSNFAVDAVKRSEDGKDVILRIHEYQGMRTPLTVMSDFGMVYWTPVNMLEEAIDDTVDVHEIHDYATPYEIKNYRICFNTMRSFEL